MKNRKFSVLIIALMIGAAFAFNSPVALAKDMTSKDFVAEAKENITTISVSEAKDMLDKGGVLILDVREPKKYKAGYVPGAINIPRGLLEFKVGSKLPDKSAVIIVYCKTGDRSSLAAYTLVRMGYKNVKSMDGGWKAWVKADYPIE